MRDGWKVNALGDVCDVIGGGTPAKSNASFYEGDIPWATVRDMKNEILSKTEFRISEDAVKKSATNIIPANNAIIATRVGLGKVCLIKQDTAINQDLRGIIPKVRSLDVQYLYRWLQSISYIIEAEGTGATVKGVKLPFIKSLIIPLPPLPEQKRIVAILDEAFAGIEKAKANTEKNLANAKELFDSYLCNLFRNSDKEWLQSRLGDVCRFQGGSQPSKSQFSKYWKKGYVRLIQIRDYKSNNHVVYIPTGKAKRFCKKSDVMIGRYGPPLFQILRGLEGAYNVALMKAEPNEEILTKEFLYYFLKNRDIFRYINNASSRAAGQSGLNKATIEPYPICYPSKDEQRKVVASLEFLHGEIIRLEQIYQQKLTALAELKQSLLQKAFSGELTADEQHSPAEVAA